MYSSTACDIRSRRAAPAASELIADARARQPLCPRSCSGSRRWWCHLSGSWHVVRLAATPQARQHPRGLGCTGSRSRAVATRRRISDRRPPAARRHPRHLLCSNLGGLMPSEMRRSVVPLPWWGSGGTAVDIFEEVPAPPRTPARDGAERTVATLPLIASIRPPWSLIVGGQSSIAVRGGLPHRRTRKNL